MFSLLIKELDANQKQEMLVADNFIAFKIHSQNFSLYSLLLKEIDPIKKQAMLTAPDIYRKYAAVSNAAQGRNFAIFKMLLEEIDDDKKQEMLVHNNFLVFRLCYGLASIRCFVLLYAHANKEIKEEILSIFKDYEKIIHHPLLSPMNAISLECSQKSEELSTGINMPILELMQGGKDNPVSAFNATSQESAKALGRLALVCKDPKQAIIDVFAKDMGESNIASLALLTIANNGEAPEAVFSSLDKKGKVLER